MRPRSFSAEIDYKSDDIIKICLKNLYIVTIWIEIILQNRLTSTVLVESFENVVSMTI